MSSYLLTVICIISLFSIGKLDLDLIAMQKFGIHNIVVAPITFSGIDRGSPSPFHTMPWDRPLLAAVQVRKRKIGELSATFTTHANHHTTTDTFHSPHSFVLRKHPNRSQRRMLPADRATNGKPNRIEIKRRPRRCW